MIGVSIAIAAGLLTWTLLEWIIHNLIGHVPKGRHRLSREHLDHHKDPSYFTSAAKKLAAAVPVLSVLGATTGIAWSPAIGIAYALSVGGGWLAYEVLHRWIHERAPAGAYGRWARRHHLHHHFHSPRANHGVTTPLWDLVFGTYEPVRVVTVPRKQVRKLPWLVREAGGELAIDPRFGAEYQVV